MIQVIKTVEIIIDDYSECKFYMSDPPYTHRLIRIKKNLDFYEKINIKIIELKRLQY